AAWEDFDRTLPPEDQGSAFACIDPSAVGPRLFFQRVPEGKVVKNRLHLDVGGGTGLGGEERLATLEAQCARRVEGTPLRPVGAACVAGGRVHRTDRREDLVATRGLPGGQALAHQPVA